MLHNVRSSTNKIPRMAQRHPLWFTQYLHFIYETRSNSNVHPQWLSGPGQLSRYSDLRRTGRSGDRIPVGTFPAPVLTYPRAHPASCTIGRVPGLFPRSKAAGAWCWPCTPSSAEVKEKVLLYLHSPSGPSWPVLGWPLLLPSRLSFIPSR